MTTLLRRGFASSILGTLALAIAGCGGGGGGLGTPTATPGGTPNPNATATPAPNATAVPGTGGSTVTANQVVFVSNRNSTSDLFKASTDGSSAVRLTNIATSVNNASASLDKPSVSPDGTRIVFQFDDVNPTDGNTNSEIGIIGVDGRNFRRLTSDNTPAGRPQDFNPVWSSDGRFIYWTSTRSALDASGNIVNTVPQVPHIFRMSGLRGSEGLVEGSGQVGDGQVIREPSAYPSADRSGQIAYAAVGQTNTPIHIANATSGALIRSVGQPLSSGQSVFGVALSPDGARVAYSLGMTGSGTGSATIEIVNIAANSRSVVANGVSSRVGNWSRDSQTLYFDSSAGSTARRQIFTANATGQSPTALTGQNTGSDNYSPAFLSG